MNSLDLLKDIQSVSVQSTRKSLTQAYLENIYRYSKDLLSVYLNPLIDISSTKTLNRTFYQILRLYAIYLTNNQQQLLKNMNTSRNFLINFLTCPAPYIISKPSKRYTLCIDLDQTLLHSSFKDKNFSTLYRPGCKQFIIYLSKYYEIVVFTSAVKQYADNVIKPFQNFVDYCLYREHVTRGNKMFSTVKDLSRVGRPIEKIIFIDDLESNVKLQPHNSILIRPWRGDKYDKELDKIKQELIKIGKEKQTYTDIRQAIKKIKANLKANSSN